METGVGYIRSIDNLKEAFKKCNNNGYLDIIESMAIPYDEFERHFTWNESHYTRNSLIRTDDYELLVVCWESGQDSPIHDFDSKNAWIHVIKGQLKEEKFIMNNEGVLKRLSSISLGTGDFSYISGHVGLHRYFNLNEGRTVSLVFYVKPLEKWSEYDPVKNKFSERRIGYDSYYEENP